MHTLTLHRVPASTTAMASAALAAWLVVVAAHPTGRGLAMASGLAVAAVAATVDARTHRLPNALVAAAAMPVVLFGIASGASDVVLIGALVFAAPLLVIHLVSPAAMGFGDVKLALALGAVLGLVGPLWVLVALCIASGVTSVVGLIRRVVSTPFGPGLVLGAIAAVITAAAFPDSLSEGRLPWR